MPRLRCVRDRPTVNVGDPLMPEAHTEHRDFRSGNDIRTDPEVCRLNRRPGSRRNDDIVEPVESRQRILSPIIGHDDRLTAIHLGEEMKEVERKRVRIVDEQRSHPF